MCPRADRFEEIFSTSVASVALLPLLCYLECQRWLAVHDSAGADVDLQQFEQALQRCIVDRCMCNSKGVLLRDWHAQLGYK